MADIKSIGTSISELSHDDLMARIRELRGNRRRRPEKKIKAKAKPKKQTQVKNLKSLAAMMSPEERLALIKSLEDSL
jgi:hypothetical protein